MQREFIQNYIAEQYQISPQYLWQKLPSFAVYRHTDKKQKWFALVADVDSSKLGLKKTGIASIINLKCPPDVIALLKQDEKILPAYHMNKEHWFTILLDNQFDNDELCHYIDWSFDLTKA